MKLTSPEYRIRIGTIILFYAMIVTFLDGFGWYNADSGIIIAMIGFSSGLLSAGIIKQHKSFSNVQK